MEPSEFYIKVNDTEKEKYIQKFSLFKKIYENTAISVLLLNFLFYIIDYIVIQFLILKIVSDLMNSENERFVFFITIIFATKIIIKIFDLFFYKKKKILYINNILINIEVEILNNIKKKTYLDIKKINDEIIKIKHVFMWQIKNLITEYLDVINELFSLTIYIIFILIISPLVFISIFIAIIICFSLIKTKPLDLIQINSVKAEYNKYENIYCESNLNNNSDKISLKILEKNREINNIYANHSINEFIYNLKITIIYSLITIIGLYFTNFSEKSSFIMLTYINGILNISFSFIKFANFLNKYRDFTNIYSLFDYKLSKCKDEITNVSYRTNFESITISDLVVTNKYKPIKIKKLTLCIGKNYLIKGESGSGKTTLCDLFAGLLNNSDFNCDIIFDKEQEYSENKFKELFLIRHYYSQIDRHNKYGTIESIMTENITDIYNYENYCLALKLALCDDFLPINNDISGTECVYRDFNELSGGEQQRIIIASIFLKILENKKNTKIIILDEIDKHLPDEKVKKIFKNIIDQCQDNSITLIVVAHTKSTHDLDFDFILDI